MKKRCPSRRRSQRGIALLIAIFVLLLISVVAIALLVSSGTETALGANYRASSTVYYAALAGLEEARGRLLPRNPSSLVPATIPAGAILTTNQTIYIVNPSSGETVVPWDQSNPYYDKEYKTEFSVEASSVASVTGTNSVWVGNANPGPLYKWVRINAVTEVSLHTDVNFDSYSDPTTLLFYDPANVDLNGNPWPSLIVPTGPPPATAVQALEITSLAALPNGSKKILQYLVAPVTMNLTFPSALTLDGYSDPFTGPNHNQFQIRGDFDGGDPSCGASMLYPVPAIGVPDNPDISGVEGGIPGSHAGNYTGSTPSPSVAQVAIPTNLQTVQSLNQLVQYITQNADAVIQGPANTANLPSAMSSTNPMTVVITGDPTQPHQGDFTLSGGFTGYGLLLVTGTLTYTSDSSWNGIILVIGQGAFTASSNQTGGTISGAVLVAQTRDGFGNALVGPQPGPATFNYSARGNGIFYNCAQILAAQAPLTYRVLSFHEIPQ
jgi:Tfp pilus assembly protein PilX